MAVKYSRQREAVRVFLMGRMDHPTADTVYAHVRQEYPNISLGTVYRNLTRLADEGIISRVSIGNGVDRFDPNTEPHMHFLCQCCGRICDIDIPSGTFPQKPDIPGFHGRIEGSVSYLYGTCDDCLDKED